MRRVHRIKLSSIPYIRLIAIDLKEYFDTVPMLHSVLLKCMLKQMSSTVPHP